MSPTGNTAQQACTVVKAWSVRPVDDLHPDAELGSSERIKTERLLQPPSSGTATHSILTRPAVESRDIGSGTRKWRLALRLLDTLLTQLTRRESVRTAYDNCRSWTNTVSFPESRRCPALMRTFGDGCGDIAVAGGLCQGRGLPQFIQVEPVQIPVCLPRCSRTAIRPN